jgi:hypothetical protein
MTIEEYKDDPCCKLLDKLLKAGTASFVPPKAGTAFFFLGTILYN